MTGPRAPDVLERLGASLFELGPDAILVGRPDGSLLRANPAACKMLRGPHEAVVRAGRSGLVVDDAPFREALARREATGAVEALVHMRRLDGNVFPVEMSSTVVQGVDGALYVVTICRDVSERLAADRSLAHTRRTLRMVTRCNEAMLRAGSEEELYRE
ncbi:MAG TPA: PAS domain-containing protein, partial [Anaeromyxobacteraceae bacterium]|nr:PAS domain-containing protein [Anaeromyxobacteraceae bacterium]